MKYYLTEDMMGTLREMIKQFRLSPADVVPPQRPAATQALPQSPETYIARAPTGGIPAMTTGVGGSTPGSANCIVFTRDPSGPLVAVTGLFRIVYNTSSSAVAEGAWVLVTRDKYGTWWAVGAGGGAGITSINDWSTSSQTIGLGTAGTDINIGDHTTAPAYSAGVTYSRGMLAGNYRYANATPSAGNAPPNPTYWVDITDDAMVVINVPNAGVGIRGALSAEFQQIDGMKWMEGLFCINNMDLNTGGGIGNVNHGLILLDGSSTTTVVGGFWSEYYSSAWHLMIGCAGSRSGENATCIAGITMLVDGALFANSYTVYISGRIGGGVWQGTAISPTYGGLGGDVTGFTAGQVPVGVGDGTFTADARAGMLTGTGAPGSGLGYPGDVYIDTATGDLYLKS